MDLKLMKESYPVQVAEYVESLGFSDGPVFAWWVPYMLRKKDIIVTATNSHVRHQMHKQSIKEALAPDQANRNTFWTNAIKKEMGNVRVAFDVLSMNAKPLPGWKQTTGQIFFNVKMDFTRKA